MVSQVTQSLFASTYKDDYADSDNYHRILFNSGRALQARELTQMQTIIQSEIARFGRNIFKEGAAVNPGGATLNAAYEFVKLNTSVFDLPADPSTILNNIFVGDTSNLRVKILEVVPAEGSDPATLYVQYLGDASAGAATSLRLTPGETITDGANTLVVQTTNTTVNPAVGQGVKISSAEGDFFALGHFIYAPAQSLILSKYSPDFTGVVGFIATEDVVTSADNSALFDNQGAVPNTSAPGADRYRIRLTLTEQSLVDSDQVFVYFANIVESRIVETVQGTEDYNKINDLLALRTKEESGNYVVRQFKLKFDEDSDAGFLIADISPGTAYVNGYRVNKNTTTKIRLPKPTTTETINNEVVAANYGNYINTSNLIGIPNTNQCEQWDLRSATGYGGSTIGTARVRAVQEDGGGYRLYLFRVQMIGNNSFESVRSIGSSVTNYADLVLEAGVAVLKDAANNDLLFPLPNTRPSTITDISLQVERVFEGVATDGSGNATVGPLSGSQTFVNLTDWVVVADSDGSNLSSTVTITGAGTGSASITGTGVISGSIDVIAYVNIPAGTSRAKTLTETTVTTTIDSDGNGTRFINLGKADVYDVSRIRDTDSDGTDLTSSFIFDNGQRDNFYDVGRLILRSGRSIPAGNVFARFRYFNPGAGDFYSVNSYSGISYADIPSHRLVNGSTVELRDVLDFRPRINDAGTGFTGTGSAVNPLPQNTDIVTLDATYYEPRFDKLTVTEEGVIRFVTGEPDLDPKFPETPGNSLEIYRVRFNANTLDPEDIGMQPIENKRYTMADIGLLEKRIDRLEEFTTLSMLEMATENVAVFDSSGLIRTKAGFLADNFSDHFYSATFEEDYAASIDPRERVLRPLVNSNNIRLIYDSDLSTNVVLKGDNLYINYTETTLIDQPVVSRTENINPFAVITRNNNIQLSPASDEWKETRTIAPRVIDGGVRLDRSQARLFNEWQWQWSGVRLANARVGTVLGSSVSSNSSVTRTPGRNVDWSPVVANTTTTTTTTTVDRIVASETIREVVGTRVVDVAIIPFMRSRKVYFRVRGLVPYQRFFPFFDEVGVSSWCRQETFRRFASDTTDWGNRFRSAAAHPEGSSNLVSDANGTIEGSFFIPNTSAIRFRTGTREFKLLNVSVNDETQATSVATGNYTANGVLETLQSTVRSTREVTVASRRTTTSRTTRVTALDTGTPEGVWDRGGGPERGQFDPLAQSFFIDNSEGAFITKARVYFASKPTGGDVPTPVELQIRPLVNGYPASDQIVPGAVKVLTPAEVNVVSTQTQAGVLATPTDFEFDEPVYLNPFTEYAIVLLADTTAYNVYIAQTEDFILGTTQRRVSRQPSLGSLFKSQNASTWEPAQNQDLTFRLFRADFDTAGGTAILENADVPVFALDENPIQLDSASNWATVFHPNHGFDSGDTVTIYGLDSATTYGGILGTSVLGNRVVSYPDQTGYKIALDSAATSSVDIGGTLVEASQNIMFNIAYPFLETLVPELTNLSATAKFTTGKSYAGSESRFVKDTTFKSIGLLENNLSIAPRMIINPVNEAVQLGAGQRSTTMQVSLSTGSSFVSPVIDLQRASMILIENIIDKQDSDRDAVGFNTPLTFVAETEPTGGSSIAKHITVPVTLAEPAVGLKVIVSANRPSAADFQVYYRTGGEGSIITDINWTLLPPEAAIPSDENSAVYREYRYLAGGLAGALPAFTQYQLKIVMRSTNSSRVPTLKDLRVIALAD